MYLDYDESEAASLRLQLNQLGLSHQQRQEIIRRLSELDQRISEMHRCIPSTGIGDLPGSGMYTWPTGPSPEYVYSTVCIACGSLEQHSTNGPIPENKPQLCIECLKCIRDLRATKNSWVFKD